MEIKFFRKSQDVKLPTKRNTDAGLDIYAYFEEDFLVIQPHETKMISTGLSSIIDNNYFVKLAERGSTGSKGMALRCGVVDPSYRGEWFVGITNTNNLPIVICKEKAKDFFNETYSKYREYVFYPYEKAIAQAIVLPMCPVGITEINEEELNSDVTERGAGKLGSSGK